MYDLTLRPGPSLVYGWPEQQNDRTLRRRTTDVTADASRFLFQTLRVEAGVTLNDVLCLLDVCPALVEVFALRFADKVRDEVRKGPLARTADSGSPSVDAEHIELRWNWRLDTDTLEYSSVHEFEVSGVGPALQEDDPQRRLQAGERERCSLSLTPIRELLHLPVVLQRDFVIAEADLDSRRYGEPVASGHLDHVTLGQLMHSLLSELTFHGGPAEQKQLAEEQAEQLARVSSGEEPLVDAEEVFAKLLPEDAAFEAMFETLGDVTRAEVHKVMHEIEDDEVAGTWFDKHFGGSVRVRQEHHGLTARQFRKAFQAAICVEPVRRP